MKQDPVHASRGCIETRMQRLASGTISLIHDFRFRRMASRNMESNFEICACSDGDVASKTPKNQLRPLCNYILSSLWHYNR